MLALTTDHLNIPGQVVAINLKQGQVGTEYYTTTTLHPQGVGDAYGQSEQFSNKDVVFGGIKRKQASSGTKTQ